MGTAYGPIIRRGQIAVSGDIDADVRGESEEVVIVLIPEHNRPLLFWITTLMQPGKSDASLDLHVAPLLEEETRSGGCDINGY